MVAKPSFYLDATRHGLALYATTVLPSLFPFYFVALMLTKIGAAKTLSTLFEKPMRKLYLSPQESAYVMVLSMLSGYPVGASCLAELYKMGTVSQADVMRISAFTSTSGPIFMLGTVGSAIFGNVKVGIIILVSHYLGALLNGLIFRRRRALERIKENANKTHSSKTDGIKSSIINSNENKSNHITNEYRQNKFESYKENAAISNDKPSEAHEDIDVALSESVAKSTMSMLTLGGYIVLAGLIIDTLELVGARQALQKIFGDGGQIAVSLLFGLVEMTRGSIECAKCASYPLGVAMCCGIVSFGGLSVIMQTYSFLSQTNMKLSQVLARKLAQALVSFLIALGLSFALQKVL
ncbi:MAG: hypothetical protein IJ226_01505 [Clostridia bacterium]|nr:hypothetical protein [Clostridia bacterium]